MDIRLKIELREQLARAAAVRVHFHPNINGAHNRAQRRPHGAIIFRASDALVVEVEPNHPLDEDEAARLRIAWAPWCTGGVAFQAGSAGGWPFLE